MAVQKQKGKTGQKSKPRGAQAVVIFWFIFVIVIISVSAAKWPVIKENFALFKKTYFASSGEEEETIPVIDENTEETAAVVQKPQSVTDQSGPRQPAVTEPAAKPQSPPEKPVAQTQQPKPQVNLPKPVETRDRTVYFTQLNRDGQILQSKTIRKIPVSNSPMVDTLNVLLIGPSADEINNGMLNLIPKNTKIVSATVRGETAYISFNEDFLFNTFGVEGYVAQLRQIVWTVTEFQNVKDVQVLIEGRRLDYLGEGIWIGSPISRQSF